MLRRFRVDRRARIFEIMSQSRSLYGTERPPKSHLQYVVAGVVVLEVPARQSSSSRKGAVGLGSQKSKDERGHRLTKAQMAITQLFCF